jgi:hypothetical protein
MSIDSAMSKKGKPDIIKMHSRESLGIDPEFNSSISYIY